MGGSRRFASLNAEAHMDLGRAHLIVCLVFIALSSAGFAAPPVVGSDLAALRANLDRAKSAREEVSARWALADALLDRGLALEAERTLRVAAAHATDNAQRLGTALRLGAALSATGKVDEAREQLDAVESAAASLPAQEVILLHQARGALAVRSGDLVAAEQAYEAEAAAASAAGAAAAEVRARTNALRARLDRKEIAEVEQRLAFLDKLATALPPGEEAAMLLLAVGDLFERDVQEFRAPVEQRASALDAYLRARDYATNPSTRAYAFGLLGSLYEDEGRNPDALKFTRAAIALAQSLDAQDQLYRWQWQAARLERKRGDAAASMQSIDLALFALANIRGDLLQSSRQAFAARIEPVYLDYADAHLRESAALADGSEAQQRVLRDVRDQLESLKQAEVQDYFDNSCAVGSAADASRGTNIPGAAIIYPILLPDRTEVLIESGGRLRRFSSPVSRGELTAMARKLRIGLERPSAGEQYRAPAEALYRWLLADAAPWLESQKVDTLVFVPTGALRTVPLAALHDGQRFLIERFAVATTPAITLIPALVAPNSNRILVAGLTKSVQGFVGLPSVGQEISEIGAIFPTESLKDETFSLASIRADLSVPNFSVAHLATHGEFSADHRQSFILTYDSRLTMDGLQTALGRRNEPLDLLVLSACSTAAGDDRAALGLAGVAIQAGAKSALASLWSISDEATAALMQDFYQSRKDGRVTKAQSLREAQLKLLATPEYRHPSYWAPYLLIGNWL